MWSWEAGPGQGCRTEPRIWALWDRRAVSFLLRLRKKVSKADPEVAGLGGLLQTGKGTPGCTRSGQKRDREGLSTARQGASNRGLGLAGLLPSRRRAPGCMQEAGFEGHDLAPSCRSHRFPAATSGVRPSL